MKVSIPKGEYVVAVSGGVDSMVLLDILRKQKNLDLTVAHFNHGIRSDSSKDENLVRAYCQKYEIPFTTKEGKLTKNASEEEARNARYKFLRDVAKKTKSDAIITAHHKDDVIETAIINIIRGTARRGMTSLSSTAKLLRPLLDYDKSQIINYAEKNNVPWREDSTNSDEKYLRNYVRKNIAPKLVKSQFNSLLQEQSVLNDKIKIELRKISKHVQLKKNEIKRREFINLPHDVACEVVREFLGEQDIKSINRRTIDKIVHFIKTAKVNTSLDISKKYKARAKKDSVIIES